MSRPDCLRNTPRWDRSAAGMRWTTYRRLQVVDLFCGRGGVGYAIADLPAPIDPPMHAGFDKEDYSGSYPGQFGRVDLLDADQRRFDADRDDLAAAIETDFPRTPGSLRVASNEVEGPDLPPRRGFTADVVWCSFPCPDAYRDPLPDEEYVTIDTRDDQSVKPLAEAKGVPAEWGTQGVRSAIPNEYVNWILHHCPSVPATMPRRDQPVLVPRMETALGVVES